MLPQGVLPTPETASLSTRHPEPQHKKNISRIHNLPRVGEGSAPLLFGSPIMLSEDELRHSNSASSSMPPQKFSQGVPLIFGREGGNPNRWCGLCAPIESKTFEKNDKRISSEDSILLLVTKER